MTTTKLPTIEVPLVKDPELAATLEAMLSPYSGKQLEKAQNACRKVFASRIEGSFSQIIAAYQTAIDEALAPA